jgi:hypothetical protein
MVVPCIVAPVYRLVHLFSGRPDTRPLAPESDRLAGRIEPQCVGVVEQLCRQFTAVGALTLLTWTSGSGANSWKNSSHSQMVPLHSERTAGSIFEPVSCQ